jgi:hypothetical protein
MSTQRVLIRRVISLGKSTELIAAELKIHANSTLSYTEVYDFLLSKPELLKLIHSNEK